MKWHFFSLERVCALLRGAIDRKGEGVWKVGHTHTRTERSLHMSTPLWQYLLSLIPSTHFGRPFYSSFYITCRVIYLGKCGTIAPYLSPLISRNHGFCPSSLHWLADLYTHGGGGQRDAWACLGHALGMHGHAWACELQRSLQTFALISWPTLRGYGKRLFSHP